MGISGGVATKFGTAFPSSPGTNDRFYRTDLRLEFFYDGTRWLSTQLFVASGGGNTGFAASSGAVAPMPYYLGLDFWIERTEVMTKVSTTNDGSNNWSGTVWAIHADATNNVLATWTTSADTVGTFFEHTTAVNAANVRASTTSIQFSVTKNASPGVLHIVMSVWYRLIAT